MNASTILYDVVWVYDGGLDVPTGRQVTLLPNPSASTIRSALTSVGFECVHPYERSSDAVKDRILTELGVMMLRPVAG